MAILSNPQIEKFKEQIKDLLPTHGSPERAAQKVRANFESMGEQFKFTPEMTANLDAACAAVRASMEDVEILRRCSLIKEREVWYHGPDQGSKHWLALDRYLRNTKGWDDDTVDSINDTSSEVVSLLANPRKEQFRCRGLVVGYVQSGKTANMTAVIAKAVDEGYNLIVLLAGMTNKLRAQTQSRLEADIVNLLRPQWQLYTTEEDDGDFAVPANGQFTMPVAGRAQLAIMKKVTSRLRSFHRTIKKTPPAILRSLKVLIIDDECDQASINSAKDDFDITKINEAIRNIIKSLPAVSYIGYTATPFANVFINPFPNNEDELDDLYPEDFITALPRPKGYFGAREVFGRDPVDADDETDSERERDMIRIIPGTELSILRPDRAADKDTFCPEIAPSLERALLWYIASCAIRHLRNQSDSHMTMLVHSSPNIIQHRRMADEIKKWISANKQHLAEGSGSIYETFCDVVVDEFSRVASYGVDGRRLTSADQIAIGIEPALKRLEVAIENGESDERLDYDDENPKTYIVVGGAVLARGLTLEGLCVSFFLRTAKQYDTLLQMGRWFGYRHGYEDLPRLWTTSELASSFRALAHIEEEIREDIDVYRDKKTTPLEFAVKVRSIPGMAITSASKMRHAYRTSISFEGRHVQTIRFDHLNDEVVAGNWVAASRLADDAGGFKHAHGSGSALLAEGVSADIVRKFLVSYSISDQHMDLKKQHVLGFFDKSVTHMPLWNVGIVLPKGTANSDKPLGNLGKVPLLERSRLDPGDEDTFADIKGLMSKQDVLIDATERPESVKDASWSDLKACRPPVPLLLLYPIDKDSKPRPGTKSRIALNAVGDLVGVALVFPGEQDRSGDYYQVELDAPTPEQLNEEEVVEDDIDAVAELINE